jgi:hypothetical protein
VDEHDGILDLLDALGCHTTVSAKTMADNDGGGNSFFGFTWVFF